MRNAKILIVEDESIVAIDLADLLVGMGHEVVGIGASAAQAMELAVKARPELVLMDIRIRGDMDGVELAGLMQTSLQVPVIYLSAYADDATLQRAGATRPYGYLLKPVHEAELKAAIETALARHESEKRHLASERERHVVFNALPHAVVAVDAEGRVAFVNQAAERLLGVVDAEVRGQAVAALLQVAGDDLLLPGTARAVFCATATGTRDVTIRVDACTTVYPSDPQVVLTLTPRD